MSSFPTLGDEEEQPEEEETLNTKYERDLKKHLANKFYCGLLGRVEIKKDDI